MLKRFKKVSSLLLIFALVLVTSIPAFAEGLTVTNLEFLPSVQEYSTHIGNNDDISPRIPNGIPIRVNPKSDGTGVKVYVGNIGVDSLDYVKVTVSASGHSKSKSQTARVIPVIGKNFNFNFPMVKAYTKYNVTVKIVDGSGTRIERGEGVLDYSESKLSGVWNRGTFSTRADSLEYHFKKHKKEVSSKNLIDYINKALIYRSEVLESTENIRTSTGTSSIPSTKYKHLIDKRFIILVDANDEILSFGK